MKRIYTVLLITLCLIKPAFGAGIESTLYTTLISRISRVQAPLQIGTNLIFTASGKARYTGIAFEHEQYKKVYPFQRLIRKDELGEPKKDDQGNLAETILFYIAEIPPGMDEIHYRIVIDGLWSTDPQNKNILYDYANGMDVSVQGVVRHDLFQTQNVLHGQVRFTYNGKSGATIRLAGTFNNWDPFMYEMEEISPGRYELSLPLPSGTWYYAYFEGANQVPDNTNTERVYTRDGRIASVVIVN